MNEQGACCTVELRRHWRGIAATVGMALVAGAIITELRKPAAVRDGHGRVAGCVPYDLRLPTWARIKAAWWDPDNPRILTSKAFGVGWDVNVGRLVRCLGKKSCDVENAA